MERASNAKRTAAFLWAGAFVLHILIGTGISAAQQDQPPSSASQSNTHQQSSPSSQTDQSTPTQQIEQPKADVPQSQPGIPEQKETSAKAAAQKQPTKKRRPVKKKGSTQSGKVVVRNGGAKDDSGQLAPAMSQEQELHSRENTAQLLATTDSNLKAIAGRQLSDSQQGMVDQIRAYVRQSKVASDAGDLPRAHTLAYKAHLLSDELSR